MAFLVGDSGTSGANSFVSVAEYLAHFHGSVGFNSDDLTAVATATIERHLIEAARMLAMVPWNGTTKTDDDDEVAEISPRLFFPRYSCEVEEDAHPSIAGLEFIPDDVVPGVVKAAQIELAEELRIREADGERVAWRMVDDRRNVLRSKRSIVGSSKTWEDPAAALRFPRVEALVRGLYSTAGTHPVAVAV